MSLWKLLRLPLYIKRSEMPETCPLVDVLLFIKLALRVLLVWRLCVLHVWKIFLYLSLEIFCLPFSFLSMISDLLDWGSISKPPVAFCSVFLVFLFCLLDNNFDLTFQLSYHNALFHLAYFSDFQISLLFSFSQYATLVLWMQNLVLSQGYYLLVGFLLFLFTSIRFLFLFVLFYLFLLGLF